MQALVTVTTSAPNYGFALALQELGHKVYYWDMKTKPVFDVFDEFAPDIVIAEAKQINRGLFKALLKHSAQLKCVALWLGGWVEDHYVWIDKSILASDAEKETVLYLKDKLPLIGLCYTPDEFSSSHYMWEHNGVDNNSVQPACAIPTGRYRDELACDIVYCGPRTRRASDLIPKVCNLDYKVKIFSKSDDEVVDWGLAQYLGRLSPSDEADAYASAKIALAIPEYRDCIPDETPYNILGAGGHLVCAESQRARAAFYQEDVCASFFYRPEELSWVIDHCAHYKRYGEHFIKDGHTYIHRVKKALARVL